MTKKTETATTGKIILVDPKDPKKKCCVKSSSGSQGTARNLMSWIQKQSGCSNLPEQLRRCLSLTQSPV